MANLARLERAGLIKSGAKLSQEQKSALESLSREDVDTLLAIKKKLGSGFSPIDGLMGTKKMNRPR